MRYVAVWRLYGGKGGGRYVSGKGILELLPLISLWCCGTNPDSFWFNAVENGDLKRAEGLLIAQAHSLDALFGYFARKASTSQYVDHLKLYMNIGLRAQSQCRATLETLAEIKKPPPLYSEQQGTVPAGKPRFSNACPQNTAGPILRSGTAGKTHIN